MVVKHHLTDLYSQHRHKEETVRKYYKRLLSPHTDKDDNLIQKYKEKSYKIAKSKKKIIRSSGETMKRPPQILNP